jgi:hypothetical protein
MKNQSSQTNPPVQQANKEGKINLPGYPLYPASEDIFNKSKEEGEHKS